WRPRRPRGRSSRWCIARRAGSTTRTALSEWWARSERPARRDAPAGARHRRRRPRRRGSVDPQVLEDHLGGEEFLDPVVAEPGLAEDLPGVLPDDGRRAVAPCG